jgi:hypothetical protein
MHGERRGWLAQSGAVEHARYAYSISHGSGSASTWQRLLEGGVWHVLARSISVKADDQSQQEPTVDPDI